MRRKLKRLLSLGISILGLLTLSPALLGQASADSEAAIPVPSDWSHHHLIFSRPATAEQEKRVQKDPRYWQQQYRLQFPVLGRAVDSGEVLASRLQTSANVAPSRKNKKLQRDWQESMGVGASVGAGNYPAKFSFLGTSANCVNTPQPDFVVYSTGLTGSGTQASVVAYDNLYSGCSRLNLRTAANFAVLGSSTVTNAGNSVVTGANIGVSPGTSLTGFPPGVLTSPAVEYLGDPVAAQAQADANTAYTHYQGLTGAIPIGPTLDGLTFTHGVYNAAGSLALSAGATVTLNGNGIYIFQIGSTLNFAGTVVLSGGATAGNVIWLVGSSATLEGTALAVGDIVAIASITLDSGASLVGRAIALNGAVTMIDNAITTADTVPSVYWAYNTGGQILTSPDFSRDGTQVMFVQTSGGVGSFVLLKWKASATETVGSPGVPTSVSAAAYSGCATPCMTTFPLKDGSLLTTNDTTSSVFFDFSGDTAWVGDSRGWVHRFNPVFTGTPAEVRTSPWPVQVNPLGPLPLASAVYDHGSGNVFVGDAGGFFYSVSAATGTVTASSQLDHGTGIVAGPLVDSTAGLAYVFASNDGSTACAGGPCAAVYRFASGFAAGTAGAKVTVGASSATPEPLYVGALDSAYESSTDAAGNLYVCGNTGGDPTLYQVQITSGGVLGTVVAGPVLSGSNTGCSPVTHVLNPSATGGATEFIFASVQTNGTPTSCAGGGCIMNFKDTPWQALTVYTVGQEVLDSNFHIEVVATAATSGATIPLWNIVTGGNTTDGTVQWLDQGPVSVSTPAAWIPLHLYASGSEIVDNNNNIELVTLSGTSGSSIPTFNATAGGTAIDGTATWTNVGAVGTFALPAAGGTSAIIIDNTVSSKTRSGASEVYFSTLSDQVCGTTGTSGCAVQASQAALQ
jgi:hypothetical protein